VLDTFLIATVKLDGLRDPDRLGPWLHAVARNECLRRLGPGQEIPSAIPPAIPAAIRAAADRDGEPPEVPLPADLRGQVLTACADNSPAGRAHRMSVAHRAGVFGPAGFPKAIGSSGPWWWQRVRWVQPPQASGLGLGRSGPAPVSSTARGAIGPTPSPARTTPTSTPSPPTSSAALAGTTSAGPSTPAPPPPPSPQP
jgi:hypothetical protein